MSAKETTLTRKGQVTIPKELRDILGLKPFDKIEVRFENGTASFRKARHALDDIAGILPPLGIPIEDMAGIAMEEWTDDFAAAVPPRSGVQSTSLNAAG